MRVPDLASYLVGTWCVVRRLADRRSGVTGRFRGTAAFTLFPDGLRYDEQGTLAYGTFIGEATRALWFEIGRDAAAVHVRFDDGRPFHSFDPRSRTMDVEHDCGSDRYKGRYRFGTHTGWTLIWRVEGPRKQIVIRTRYLRLRSAPPAIGLHDR